MPLILVIDDDPAIRILLERTLTKCEYDVILANDGQEGLAKARAFHPALIICDWMMPELSGIEVCRYVKAIPELSTTFFILLTSLSAVEDRVQGLDAGSDDFLCKPIEMNELKARVRAGLRLHQLSQDLQQQKQLLEAELAEAAEYVSSILPEPLQLPHLKIDTRFIPSRQLGGDIFDYFWLDGDRLVMYLLDVSGHGLRAALPSLSVINLLRSRGLNKVNYGQPNEVLTALNQAFQMTQRNDKYFTIWYGVYHVRKHQLIYASAGHPPAILISPDANQPWQDHPLKTSGFPIGMFSNAHYLNASCSPPSSSSLYLFSDGIYEIEKADGKIVGLQGFIETLKEYQGSSQFNLDQLLEKIVLSPFSYQFKDDVSIMQINFSY